MLKIKKPYRNVGLFLRENVMMKQCLITKLFLPTALTLAIMIPTEAKTNKEIALNLAAKMKAGAAGLNDDEKTLNDFLDNFFITTMRQAPQALSMLGLFESVGIRDHNAHLNDVSPEAIGHALTIRKHLSQQLKKYSPTDLSGDLRISYDVAQWSLDHALEGEPFLFHDYRVTQLIGILSDISSLMTQIHRLKDGQDVDHYLARLRAMPIQIYQTVDLLSHQEHEGIIAPTFALEKVIKIIRSLTPEIVSDHIFYKYLADHIAATNHHDSDTALTQAYEIIANHIYPAFSRLQNYVTHQMIHHRSCNGVWALPDGDNYYAYTLKRHTTTNLTADQIHELGLKEVARIHEQMRIIFESEGIIDPSKTVGQMVQELADNADFFYEQTEEGCKQCVADFESILERCRKELYPLFDLKPSAPVQVHPVPLHQQEGAPGAYYCDPSLDGSRPGVFFINLRDMKEVPKYGMETLAVHEAEPGHHFQLALQQEMDMHIGRKASAVECLYTAYIEGWALYTERLAYEQGFYSSSWSKLGHLQDELLRAARLVVDTGIHKKRWTRDQAIEYMIQATGYHRNTVVTEVERYFVWPGQACSYKIGQLKILKLRTRAQDALGSKFDIRDFHNIVLAIGAVPLVVLEKAVDEYIDDKRGR